MVWIPALAGQFSLLQILPVSVKKPLVQRFYTGLIAYQSFTWTKRACALVMDFLVAPTSQVRSKVERGAGMEGLSVGRGSPVSCTWPRGLTMQRPLSMGVVPRARGVSLEVSMGRGVLSGEGSRWERWRTWHDIGCGKVDAIPYAHGKGIDCNFHLRACRVPRNKGWEGDLSGLSFLGLC